MMKFFTWISELFAPKPVISSWYGIDKAEIRIARRVYQLIRGELLVRERADTKVIPEISIHMIHSILINVLILFTDDVAHGATYDQAYESWNDFEAKIKEIGYDIPWDTGS